MTSLPVGIITGPSLSRRQWSLHTIFPQYPSVLETGANIALLFFLFLLWLNQISKRLNEQEIRPLALAAAGISLPFVARIGIAYVLMETICKGVGYGRFLVFTGVSISITECPVLARIPAELKLLTIDVGQMAMAAAALNDLVAWVLLALSVALIAIDKSPVISIYVLLCGLAFLVFMIVAVKPVMTWIGHSSPDKERMSERYSCITLPGVLAAGFVTDVTGIHTIFGVFVLL